MIVGAGALVSFAILVPLNLVKHFASVHLADHAANANTHLLFWRYKLILNWTTLSLPEVVWLIYVAFGTEMVLWFGPPLTIWNFTSLPGKTCGRLFVKSSMLTVPLQAISSLLTTKTGRADVRFGFTLRREPVTTTTSSSALFARSWAISKVNEFNNNSIL